MNPLSKMQIAVVHCHFERGGVTQVVQNHVSSSRFVSDFPRFRLVSGGRLGGLQPGCLEETNPITIDGLDYDAWSEETLSEETLHDRLVQALAEEGCMRESTILHWHNHSLGKNTKTPGVIRRLADNGWRMLLQIHDFAEDGRPENLMRLVHSLSVKSPESLDSALYPSAQHVHYATLTSGDRDVLLKLGLPPSRVHLLPNGIDVAATAGSGSDEEGQPSKEDAIRRVRAAHGLPNDATWSIYPVRGIRRKNVGEWLLLSRWTAPHHYSGITLPPATEIEFSSYQRWREVGAALAPRAVFDAGHHVDVSFMDNLMASEQVLSTSVAEGFGMVFLEPWLVNRRVLGRRIQGVTDDFLAAGMDLEGSYEEIPIPGDADWNRLVRQEYREYLSKVWAGLPAAFQVAEWKDEFEEPIDATEDGFDFGRLSTVRQVQVLKRCSIDSGFEEECKSRSADLVRNLVSEGCSRVRSQVHRNRHCVNSRFGLPVQAQLLKQIYAVVAESPSEGAVTAPPEAGSGVRLAAKPHAFAPCRIESQEAMDSSLRELSESTAPQ
ncbi:MAG: hypothetical protein AAF989_01025 [Planctomycetota bacterium]